MNWRALFRIVDFFLPIEVLSSVLLIFAMENALASALGPVGPVGWLLVYGLGILVLFALQYASADDDELDDLAEDIRDLDDEPT